MILYPFGGLGLSNDNSYPLLGACSGVSTLHIHDCIYSSQQPCDTGITSSFFPTRKLSLREVQQLIRGHEAMAGVGPETKIAGPCTRGRVTSAHSSLCLSGPVSFYEGNLAPIASCLIDCLTRVIASRGSVHGKNYQLQLSQACFVSQKSHLE